MISAPSKLPSRESNPATTHRVAATRRLPFSTVTQKARARPLVAIGSICSPNSPFVASSRMCIHVRNIPWWCAQSRGAFVGKLKSRILESSSSGLAGGFDATCPSRGGDQVRCSGFAMLWLGLSGTGSARLFGDCGVLICLLCQCLRIRWSSFASDANVQWLILTTGLIYAMLDGEEMG